MLTSEYGEDEARMLECLERKAFMLHGEAVKPESAEEDQSSGAI